VCQKGKQNKAYNGGVEIRELIYNELEIPFGKMFDVNYRWHLVHLNFRKPR